MAEKLLPQIFRKDPPFSINYDFTDIMSNSGYAAFYGFLDEAGNYNLSRIACDSQYHRVQYTVGVSGLQGEINFNYTFATSQYIKGDMYLTLTYFAKCLGVQTVNCYLKIRILHYDGSTETVIGTQQTTDTLEEAEDAKCGMKRTTLKFSVDKQFGVGEILRIEIETYSTTTNNAAAGFFCDGGDRDPAAFPDISVSSTSLGQEDYHSNIILQVPFSLAGSV